MSTDQQPRGLSKSKFMLGLQCPNLLWWTVHEPYVPELDGDDDGTVLERGLRIGELARQYAPGGLLIDQELEILDRVAATQTAVAQGARVVYEASFRAEGVTCCRSSATMSTILISAAALASKELLPALVPELGYEDLEILMEALLSATLEALLLGTAETSTRERLFSAGSSSRTMSDTLAMERLYERPKVPRGRWQGDEGKALISTRGVKNDRMSEM